MAFLDTTGLKHFLEKLDARFLGINSTAANASKVNGHTVNSDVPSGAKFTDTNTTYGKGTYNTLGLTKPSKSYTKAATLKTTAASDSSNQPTINAITTTAGKYYAVEADVNGVPFVNVPWTDHTYTIPSSLKNPNKLTFTGGSTATYDGTSAVSVAIPTTLKNPNKLTFTGGATGSYDGSAAVSIAIPTKTTKSITLTASSWSNGKYTISDSAIKADSVIFFDAPIGTTSDNATAILNAQIVASSQAAGSLVLQALGTVPTTSVSITLVIM